MFSAIISYMLGRRGYSPFYTLVYVVVYMMITAGIVAACQQAGLNALVCLGVYFLISIVYVLFTKSKRWILK